MFNMTPEMRDFLLHMGGGLLMGGRNNAEAVGRGLLMGAQGRNEGMVLRDRQKTNDLDRQMRQQQIEQHQGMMADRTGMRNAFQTAFQQPNQNLVQNDDQGFAMPQAPGGGGMPEFLKMAGQYMDPLQAAQMMQPKPRAPMILGKGARAFDESGREVAANPEAEKPLYQAGQTRELKSGRTIYTQEYDGKEWKTIGRSSMDAPDKSGPEKPPQGYRWDGKGGLEAIRGGPADPANKASDTERMASGYASRMEAAEKLMGPLEKKGEAKPGIRESVLMAAGQETLANALPSIMGGRSNERQSYRQAQEDWVRAKLRKESGAVIADAEMDREIRTYFPQIGDGQKVVEQKAAARRVAIDGMRTSAGAVAPKLGVDDLLRKYLGQ
jgi:hypothetical protein